MFWSVVEILKCDVLNKSYRGLLSSDAVYLVNVYKVIATFEYLHG